MPSPQANLILSQLPDEEYKNLLPHMKLVSLQKGEILFEPGRSIVHYYFPVACALELAIDMADGKVGATSFINMNSIYPLHLIGETESHNRATVCCAGLCYRIPAWAIHDELRRSQSLLWILLKESIKLFELATIESACLRHHTLEQVTAKLILMSMDNTRSPIVQLTHQEMANSLGTRREGITMVLKKLRGENFISTDRGSVTVLDREGLERTACGCYQSLREMRPTAIDKAPRKVPNHV